MKALIEAHGSVYKVPADEMAHLHEVLRAQAVLDINPNEDPKSMMRRYGIAAKAAAEVLGDSPDTFMVSRKPKRADKYAAIITWCKENVGAETNVYQIAEVGEVSYSTANNFIKDRIDLFRKIKKGQYIVRDPETERATEK